jgi:hypothetical protein
MFGICVTALAVLCGGCIAYKGHNAFDGVSPSYPDAPRGLAEDAAGHLSMAFPPGHTSVSLNTESNFGKHLEDALRRKGFVVSEHGMTVGYNVDMLKDEATPMCYVRLVLGNGGEMSQMYGIGKGILVPVGNLVTTGLPDFTQPYVASATAAPPLTLPETQAEAAMEPEPRPGNAPELPRSGNTLAEVKALPVGTPAVPLATESGWRIAPGLLRVQLKAWTDTAGYQLVWKSRNDFEMSSHVMFRSDFVGAVKRLFARMHLHGNPLRATIYQDNRVLEVVEE